MTQTIPQEALSPPTRADDLGRKRRDYAKGQRGSRFVQGPTDVLRPERGRVRRHVKSG